MIRPAPDFAGSQPANPGKGFGFLLSGGREAGFAARQAVIERDGALPASVREDVLLLVTELVTNAVRHAGVGPEQSMRVDLRWWPRRVRLEVVDPGTSFKRPPARPRSDDLGGWGLVLVDRIADRWGVQRTASGTCVWCELGFEASGA